MIPATPEPKIPENGPEPEFRPEFRRNFEPSQDGMAHHIPWVRRSINVTKVWVSPCKIA
jgi:hypothetical protein